MEGVPRLACEPVGALWPVGAAAAADSWKWPCPRGGSAAPGTPRYEIARAGVPRYEIGPAGVPSYEIALAGGRAVRVPAGFDDGELARLIAVVESAPMRTIGSETEALRQAVGAC